MSKNDVNIKTIPNSVDLKKLRKLGREYNWDTYKLYIPTPNPKFIEKSIINGGNVLIWGASKIFFGKNTKWINIINNNPDKKANNPLYNASSIWIWLSPRYQIKNLK